VPRKLTVLLAALVVLVPAVVTGCGGGGDKTVLTKGNLGVTDNLKAAQDDADIQEFCSLAATPKGELYDRSVFSVIAATDDLILVYKRHPDGTYYDAIKKREIKLKQLASDEAKKLSGCGRDGKTEALKLTQALQTK
jgi:hypothetical protein